MIIGLKPLDRTLRWGMVGGVKAFSCTRRTPSSSL
ncbi:Oxidoreductase [Klebsiella pneumoniae]|nr:Oxidoreductase [Klebsiella pneumoniae]